MGRFDAQKRSANRLTPISDLMDRSLKGGFLFFLDKRLRFRQAWLNVVGEDVGKRTKVVSFEMGRLEVFVAGPAYLDRYRYKIKEWLKRLNIEFGEEVVEEIVLKVGDVS
jgi:hypothetical protein